MFGCKMRLHLLIAAALALCSGTALAAPLAVSFDFSQSELGIELAVKGQPLFMLLDTGVDPSMIDLKRAQALGMPIDLKAGGEASGVGDAKSSRAYPARIEGLAMAGRVFGPVEALTADLGELSASYGRHVDGFLGFSFLHDKIVLVDYPRHRLEILDHASDADAEIRRCRRRWEEPMRFLKDENWPLIADFRLGDASLPATLDTGSSGSVTLYAGALALPGVRAALVKTGQGSSAGFRGTSKLTRYTFNAPAGFGPFRLPPGQAMTLRHVEGSADASVANLGNKLFAQLGLKMLLDYRDRKVAFFGGCS